MEKEARMVAEHVIKHPHPLISSEDFGHESLEEWPRVNLKIEKNMKMILHLW